jgi:hypothetical protein
MCLGQVWNQSSNILTNIKVRVTLFGEHGQIISEQTIGLEQRYLPPETAAPYRAIFQHVKNEEYSTHAQVARVSVVNTSGVPITISEARGILSQQSGRYVVTANIHNKTEQLADHIRLIVTLFDNKDAVIGYRIYPLDHTMPANSEQAVRVEVIPLMMGDNVRHILNIEAWNE